MTTTAYATLVRTELATDLRIRAARTEQRHDDLPALRRAYYDARLDGACVGLDIPATERSAIRAAVARELGWTPEREPRYLAATFRNQRRQGVGAVR